MRVGHSTAAILIAACLASSPLAQGPNPVDDEQILVEVQRTIWNEPSLSGTDIKVEIRGGVVTLKGFAGTMENIATAGRLARAVPGVSAVNNSIRIAIRPSRA